jgi:predicted nucleotidyltransferase
MIPELVDNVLPEGIHECTFEEVREVFGRFWRTDRRIRLTERLAEFLAAAKKSGIVAAVIVDGSYVTGKEAPSDIDLIVAYKPDFSMKYEELRPFEYSVVSKRAIKRSYRFDAFIFPDGSDEYRHWVDFFGNVRADDPELQTSRTRKGVLRIAL